MDRPTPWVTPSELADEAFCPRARWYRRHPPPSGRSAASVDRSDAGTSVHAQRLGAERRRDERLGGYVAALAVGIVALVAGVAWLGVR